MNVLKNRWKMGEKGKKTGRKEESGPWPLWPRDVSEAGRGRNWEWHSWLELPNCHFLSSLFTHSRSLSWTFEELRTDMCLLVQPSLGTVIIVAHEHSIKTSVFFFVCFFKMRMENSENVRGSKIWDWECLFLVIDGNMKLSLSSSFLLFSSLCLLTSIIGFKSPQWLGAIKLLQNWGNWTHNFYVLCWLTL